MIKLIESDYIKLLPTKQEIIQRINQLCRKYGKSDVGKSLYHNLCDIGYYTEDKRKSFIQFAIDVLNNSAPITKANKTMHTTHSQTAILRIKPRSITIIIAKAWIFKFLS